MEIGTLDYSVATSQMDMESSNKPTALLMRAHGQMAQYCMELKSQQKARFTMDNSTIERGMEWARSSPMESQSKRESGSWDNFKNLRAASRETATLSDNLTEMAKMRDYTSKTIKN